MCTEGSSRLSQSVLENLEDQTIGRNVIGTSCGRLYEQAGIIDPITVL
jgi:hypothetical protein